MKLLLSLILFSFYLANSLATSVNMPCVNLTNAAVAGTCMPMVGLGTGSYPLKKAGGAAQVWNYSIAFTNAQKWINLGGRRIDAANDYIANGGVADGIINITNHYTIIQRSELFIVSKIGPYYPLGYNDTINQFKRILKAWDTDYIDLLLIHWPSSPYNASTNGSAGNFINSTDKYCNPHNKSYNVNKCRQSTWLGMQYILTELKSVKAIGISNYEMKHFNDILNMNQSQNGNNKAWLPSVNQIEIHGYWHEYNLINELKNKYNVTINSYAPLGTPDVEIGNWDILLTEHPTAINIGNKYNKSAAQVWLKWALQQNILVNPRSINATHMTQNMNIFDFSLTTDELDMLYNLSAPSDPKVCPDPNNLP